MNLIIKYCQSNHLLCEEIMKKKNTGTEESNQGHRAKAVPFLVYKDGEPLHQLNSITRIINSVLGKGVGSSALRHIYLTHKYGDVEKEQQKDAAAMAHSVGQQKEYILK